jgi:predicted flavoprotein YhiN
LLGKGTTPPRRLFPVQEGHGEFPRIGDGETRFGSTDLAPDLDVESFLHGRKGGRPKAELKSALTEVLPPRLEHAVPKMVLSPGPMANISDRSLVVFAQRLKRCPAMPTS